MQACKHREGRIRSANGCGEVEQASYTWLSYMALFDFQDLPLSENVIAAYTAHNSIKPILQARFV